jgi:hypothetical protein
MPRGMYQDFVRGLTGSPVSSPIVKIKAGGLQRLQQGLEYTRKKTTDPFIQALSKHQAAFKIWSGPPGFINWCKFKHQYMSGS